MVTAHGVFGLYPANAVGDDIEVYTNDNRDSVAATFSTFLQLKNL
jgi:5-methyltetrahydrofolate--homocysteine methyltransferase